MTLGHECYDNHCLPLPLLQISPTLWLHSSNPNCLEQMSRNVIYKDKKGPCTSCGPSAGPGITSKPPVLHPCHSMATRLPPLQPCEKELIRKKTLRQLYVQKLLVKARVTDTNFMKQTTPQLFTWNKTPQSTNQPSGDSRHHPTVNPEHVSLQILLFHPAIQFPKNPKKYTECLKRLSVFVFLDTVYLFPKSCIAGCCSFLPSHCARKCHLYMAMFHSALPVT